MAFSKSNKASRGDGSKAVIKAWIHFQLSAKCFGVDFEAARIASDQNHPFHKYAMDLRHLAEGDLDPEELAKIRSRYGRLRMLPLSVAVMANPKASKEEMRKALEKRGWVPTRSDPARWIGGKLYRNVYEAPDGRRGVFVTLADDGGEAKGRE